MSRASILGFIVLASNPGSGHVLTGSFSYFHRVAFKQDAFDFRTFGKNFWDLRQLEMMGVRW